MLIASESIDLSGSWRFAIDASDADLQQQWYQTSLPGSDTLELPGSMQEQGSATFPDLQRRGWEIFESRMEQAEITLRTEQRTILKMPFWLQPDRYIWVWHGIKNGNNSEFLEKQTITTNIGAAALGNAVCVVDSKEAGSVNYLSVPHTYDLSELLTRGSIS
jgi:hypothetical protein